MSAKPIELILLRQLAQRMPMPVVLLDAEGVLVYFNPATARLIGFDPAADAGIPLTGLHEFSNPRDADGQPMPLERMPIAVALRQRRPQQATMIVDDAGGTPHRILTTAIPLDGQGGALIGAMSIFWEENGRAEGDGGR